MKHIIELTNKNISEVAILSEGQCFGEQALINNHTRSATIKCKTDCHIGVLKKQDYERSVGKIQKTLILKFVSFMQNCVYFANWSKTALSKLFYFFKNFHYCLLDKTLFVNLHNEISFPCSSTIRISHK